MRRPGRGRKRPDAGHLAQDQELERALRDALHTVAESIEPAGDGLERIRRRLGEPWLARQISLIRTGCADWLPLALAMAGAVIIAVTGAFAVSQVHRGNERISLSTGEEASTRLFAGTGSATGGAGQPPARSSAQASTAQLSPAQPGSAQPESAQPGQAQRRPGGVSSAQVKPSWPAAVPAAGRNGTHPSSAVATGCPSSPTGTPSATPTLASPSATPSPAATSPPPPSPHPNPSPAVTAPGSSAPAVGSSQPACDDGRGRQ